MPKVKNEDNARGYFNLDEYKLLTRTVRKLVGSVSEIRQKIDKKSSNRWLHAGAEAGCNFEGADLRRVK